MGVFGADKYRMPHHCHSAHRCARVTCAACTWRHALHITRRIAQSGTGPFYLIALSSKVPSSAPILATRIQLRNAIDHLRRRHPHWRDLSLHLWLTRAGNLEGIIALGTLGPAEVIDKLGARWPTTLRPIEVEDLRVEVYRTLRQVRIGETVVRRYQPLALYIGPQRTVSSGPECKVDWTSAPFVEPMPMLI